MTGRITEGMLSSTTLNNLNNSLSALNRSSEEMSSGKSILQASDNPYGASEIISMQSQLDGLSSFATNAQEGTAWTDTANGALSNMATIVQRVRELLVQASNGTNTQSDLNAIGTEVSQLTEAVKQDANTQYAGQYVFAGTATTTPPYKPGTEDVYQGNEGTITRAIGPSTTVTITSNVGALLGNGQGAADGKLLDVLRTISEHLQGATPEDREALNSTDLQSLEGNIEALSALQAGAGSVTEQLRMSSSRIEELQTSVTASLSGTEDANVAQVAIAYSSEQAGYQAALRAGASILQESLLNFLH